MCSIRILTRMILRKYIRIFLKEKEEFQNQYDDETNYSRQKEKQGEWLTKIRDQDSGKCEY